MRGLPPQIAQHASRYVLLDVRPPTERFCGIGFIPGSLVLSPWVDLHEGMARVEQLAGDREPVLVCLTGERSRAQALSLGPDGLLQHLDGGIRRWAKAGWSVVGTWAAGAPALEHEPGRFQRVLRAELAEMLGEDGAQVLLSRCDQAMGSTLDACPVRRLHGWLDRVALELLDLGLPRPAVGRLVDRMLTRLPPPIPGLARLARARRPTIEVTGFSVALER